MISRNLMFTFTAMSALVLSMGLACADDISDNTMWCSKVTKPSNVVICSEPELRRLLIIRDKIFMDAKANFSPADMREMNAEQNNWVHEYTARCGADIDGPPVRFPVRRDIIECFKREARERIAELIGDMRELFPTYQMPKVDGSITYMYQDAQRLDQQGQQQQAEAEREVEQRAEAAQRLIDAQRRATELEAQAQQERQRAEAQALAQKEAAAEALRRQIQAEAAHDKLVMRLKELGFDLVPPVDLSLDWKVYMKNGSKIAVDGTYVQDDDVEVLSTPGNKDLPHIRLYTDNASRDARKLMLECRNSNFNFGSCQMVVGGVISGCIRNKGKLNEKEVPCLHVQEAFLNVPGVNAASFEVSEGTSSKDR